METVTCRRRTLKGRCGDTLKPWHEAPTYFVHTHKPAEPHYAVPWKVELPKEREG